MPFLAYKKEDLQEKLTDIHTKFVKMLLQMYYKFNNLQKSI